MIELVPPEPADMSSPCIGICVIGDDDLCEGCARTIEEIAAWGDAGFEERRRVLAEVAGRRR